MPKAKAPLSAALYHYLKKNHFVRYVAQALGLNSHMNIATKIAVLVAVLASVILAGFGAIQYGRLQASGERQLHIKAQQLAKRLGVSLAVALYNVDDKVIGQTIDAEMADLDIVGIRVLEGNDPLSAITAGGVVKVVQGRVRSETKIEAAKELPNRFAVESSESILYEQKIIGGVQVRLSDDSVRSSLSDGILIIVLQVVVIDVLLVATLMATLRSLMSQPLGRVVAVLEAMAAGDTSRRLPTDRIDEIGRLSKSVNTTVGNMQSLLEKLAIKAHETSSAADALNHTSQQLSTAAEVSAVQATSATHAADRVSTSVTTVATAAEEMTASICEISKSAVDATRIVGEAAELTRQTTMTIEALGKSSERIGEVLSIITKITQQTKLLALNATIEAARAGELGKGFSVVASEVRALANQTELATKEISPTVTSIRRDAIASVEAITRTREVIERINNIQGALAAAVEEQTATTAEITRNATEAARGANEIAQAIASVSQAAGDVNRLATSTHASSQLLNGLAQDLTSVAKG